MGCKTLVFDIYVFMVFGTREKIELGKLQLIVVNLLRKIFIHFWSETYKSVIRLTIFWKTLGNA